MQMPKDYERLVDSGLLKQLSDSSNPLFIWDANFAYVAKNGFERLDDQVEDIFPFAVTAGGHYLGYLSGRLPDSKIFLFYRDSCEAESVASGIGELLFHQIVQFAGSENLVDSDWTEETARDYVQQTANTFTDFFSPEMRNELNEILPATVLTANG